MNPRRWALIRNVGALRGIVATDGTPAEQLIFEANNWPSMAGQDWLAYLRQVLWLGQGSVEGGHLARSEQMGDPMRKARPTNIAWCLQLWIKQNILRLLVDHQCESTFVPAQTSAEDVLAMKPNEFSSNGPGDPEPVTYAVENIQEAYRPRASLRYLPGTSCAPGDGRKNI